MPAQNMTKEQLQTLIDSNEKDRVFIVGALVWGLTPVELAMLEVNQVINQKGEFYSEWALPNWISQTSQIRILATPKNVDPVLTKHLTKLKSIHANQHLISGRKFFLNDFGKPFALTSRKSGGLEARGITEKIKKMISNAGLHYDGITTASMRTSAAAFYYYPESGVKGMTLIDLKEYFGVKTLKTVQSWIRPEEIKVEEAQRQIFSHINWS